MKNYYYISAGQFGYPQPESQYRKVTYSIANGCETCWIGHEQIAEFKFKGEPKPLKIQFTGLNWVFDQIFVRQVVKNMFEKENLSGVKFSKPLYNGTQNEIPDFYQLRIDKILPQSLLNKDLPIEICEYPQDEGLARFLEANDSKLTEGPFCKKPKFNFPQGQTLVFKKEAFIGQPDFVRTHEWFGSGGDANRPILVSEKVKEIVESKMLRGLIFAKIELI